MKAKNILDFINNPQNISNADVKNIEKTYFHIIPIFKLDNYYLQKDC